MTAIPTTFGAGGANLTPTGSGTPTLAQTLRDVATDLAGIRTGVVTGMDITSADPTAVSDGAIGAFTDPPSAAEMALLRTLVNELRTTVIAIRTLDIEIKTDLNAGTAASIPALLTTAA